MRGQKQLTSTHVDEEANLSISDDLDSDTPDCYHEPLNPEQQAIFDYQTQIESGEYKEDEITIRQPTPEDWKAYEQALRHITELAAAEGVPLLPNPLCSLCLLWLSHPLKTEYRQSRTAAYLTGIRVPAVVIRML